MHVVFGHVIKGQEIIDEIQLYGDKDGKPSKKVIVSDCGILKKDKPHETSDSGSEKSKEEEKQEPPDEKLEKIKEE